MRIDRVVVNASPLICLYKSGLFDLLPALFAEIIVPDKVYKEVMAKGATDISSISLFTNKKFSQVSDVVIPLSIISWDLGEGESSVLAFALKNPDFWAVIDDQEARRCAKALGCQYTGTVGIISLAKRRGTIKSIKAHLMKLQSVGLWISDNFINEICHKANED